MRSSPPFSQDLYTQPECILRRMTSDEAAVVAAQLVEMDPWRKMNYTESGLTNYLRRYDPALSRFIVSVRNYLAGVVCVRYPWLMGANLELIALFENFRRKGIGAGIIDWFERESFLISRNVWTTVSDFNQQARAFYESRGFEEVATIPDLIRNGKAEILLRKKKPGPK